MSDKALEEVKLCLIFAIIFFRYILLLDKVKEPINYILIVFTEIEVPVQVKSAVSFSAGATKSQNEVSKGQILIFDHVLTNTGNSYNPSSGRFVAPVGGTYFFYCSLLSGNGAEIWAYIAVNGSAKVRIYARGTDGRHDTGSQALVLRLNSGDVVSVHNHIFGAGEIYGGMYTAFSGFLIN